jgi:hypothetical protein
MGAKSYLQISLRTEIDTVKWEVGAEFIRSLCSGDGLLEPEQISHNVDSFGEAFLGIERSEPGWASKASVRVNGQFSDYYQDFAWRRKTKLKSSGSVSHTACNLKGQVVPGSVCFRANFDEVIDWYALFKKWCEMFSPQVGMLHLFTDPELQPGMKYNSFQIGSFNALLSPEVPNAGWLMYYGEPFFSKIDVDVIRSAGFGVEELGQGCLVKVTENIVDVKNNFCLFDKRRNVLKATFGEGFFLDRA